MRKILFVDDVHNVLQGLKRMLRPMRHEWDMEFATSGEEALKILAENPFDIVVSDMRMPGMDGVELLGIVMERYPETVRIILSGHSDKDMILRSVKSTHQFLLKPCDAKTIKNTVERTCSLQDLLNSKTLKRIVAGIKDLPSLPILYGLILKEMQSPDTSLKKVGDIISKDVSMSAKVLQLVNSAFFGLPQEITDPQQATIYLGVDTLKALVLSIHVFSSFTEDADIYGASLADMWRHCMTTGKLAKDIAHNEFANKKVEDDALIAGILHDVGKLILLKLPEQYKHIKDFIVKNGVDHVNAEYAILKTTHAELGACLLGLWGIPNNIVETIAFHHNPSKLLENMSIIETPDKFEENLKSIDSGLKSRSVNKDSTEFAVLTSVHVANSLVKQEDCSADTTVFPYVDMKYLRTLNLTDKLPEWAECCKNIP
jgi:putative nucleotidyltransferase with HDIG domain